MITYSVHAAYKYMYMCAVCVQKAELCAHMQHTSAHMWICVITCSTLEFGQEM